MPNRRIHSLTGPETTILVVLALTLALSGVLAYHAQQAAGSHRQAAEAALRDYAAFASWELERRLNDALPGTLQAAVIQARLPVQLDRLMGGSMVRVIPNAPEELPGGLDLMLRTAPADDAERLTVFEARLRREFERCGCEEAARDFFLFDLTSEAPSPVPSSLSPSFRAWLAEVLLPEALAEGPQLLPVPGELRLGGGPDGSRVVQRMVGPIGSPFVVRPLEGPASRLVYTYLHDARGKPAAVYGFVLDVPALAGPVVRSVVETAAFLPPSLTGGAANEAVLALAVTLDGGETLYRSAGRMPASTRVVDTLHSELATLVTEVAIRPEVAGTLVIGGLPRSRLPLLLALFGITLGLVAIAAVQLRRQRVLARLRSDFISGVSHELRTPLAQIQLFAELLGTDRLRRDQRERSVRVIKEESRRLIYLVENILRFSGAERRAMRIAAEPTEVAPLVRDIVESFAPLARPREVTLTTDLDETLLAPLDRSAFRQVLLNLLDNAVKYGPRGQHVGVAAREADGWLKLSVSDQGPGVPSAERKRIWRPYHRLRRDAESATGGSGIGLAVVRELAELHGGRVAVEEGPAGGAVFEVWFPGAASHDAGVHERAHVPAEDAE